MASSAVAALVVPLGGCSDDTTADTEPLAAGVVLRVVVDGDMQSGPLLVDVLTASGVADWDTGEEIGMGEGRVFAVGLDIASAEVDDGWILDVTNKGTLKPASADLPRQDWVRDVGEIRTP